MAVFVSAIMPLSAEMVLWFEGMGVIFQLGVACLGNVLVDWNMVGDAMNYLVMGSVHRNDRQKNNRESRFIFHGAQGRTRTDTPCGGGFWVPCVYQFRHLGSGFGLLENDIIKHKYSVSTNFCKNIKKDGWYWSVLNKNSDLIWVKKVGVTMWDRVLEMQSEIKFAVRCDWWLIESVYCACDGMCVMKYRLRMYLCG